MKILLISVGILLVLAASASQVSVTMRFMVPKPNDERIAFVTLPEKIVATIRFGGFASDEKIEQYKNRLKEILAKNNIEHFDTFSYLG